MMLCLTVLGGRYVILLCTYILMETYGYEWNGYGLDTEVRQLVC